tara:strand:- start:14 stop:235 length:222 start_codon:yes stop_codon:yes gene_type:complete
MVKLVKLDAEEKLRNYLRSKYMETADRITEDRDWRDGINQFRLRIFEEMTDLNNRLSKIEEKLTVFIDGDQIV